MPCQRDFQRCMSYSTPAKEVCDGMRRLNWYAASERFPRWIASKSWSLVLLVDFQEETVIAIL